MGFTDMKKTFSQSLIDLTEQGENIAMVDADLMRIVGSNYFRDKYPERYFQVGIAEQDMIGTAAGLALTGRTVFTSSFSNFIALRDADQICNTVCYNDLNVKMCGIYAGVSSEKNGGTHISVSDINLFRGLPKMKVIDPADANEFYQAMCCAAKTPGPVYIRISKGPMEEILPQEYQFELGKGIQLKDGDDATLITTGLTTGFGIKACEALENKGIHIRHIHMPTIKPIDEELVIKAAKETKMIFTAENHTVVGGLGSAVTEVITQSCPTKVERMGIPDVFCVGASIAYLSDQHGFSAEKITDRIISVLNH
ncbi:MAG: transketolase family protein [Parasporobacterium sp.]|nr:transketolase family protein [Parasporobacterium sp.]